jgi:hypothetical protein
MIGFISENLSTVVVGTAVLGIIAFALIRTILNYRRGKFPCGCGCGNCAKNGAAPRKKSPRCGETP